MSSRNRFSYNQAVNNIAALSDNNNSIQPIQKVKEKGKVLSKNDISLPLPLYHQGSERATNSNKLHHRTPSNASSLPKYSISEFEEENLSTVDEQLNWLIPGEELMHRELNVGFHKQDKPERVVLGRVYVTNYRLRFEERVTVASTHKEHIQFDITLGSISKIEKIGYYKVRPNAGNIGPPYGINIVCKDIRNVRFINRRESHGRRALVESLRKHAFPNKNRLPFFANMYREKFQHDGWILFDVIREFQRQKVPKHAWALSRINQNYEFAGTYPALFFVPAEVFRQKSPDDFLHSVSEFRSKKRIPVLSWIDSRTSAALVRSSQPMIGALTRKSASDEDYIEMIIGANPNSRSLIILDARPRINARANRANGGGYESENYPMCKLEFMDIQNIHIVRDSLKKLKEACFPQIRPKHFQKTLEETKWLSHLLTILEAASEAARQISVNRSSVLIHCSDGWDRTAQITSLAMLQLDSFYRTIEGFAVLVEKEWCSFGHKFAHRIGHGQEKPDDKERSPIFIQFIDCVWQLYNQFTPAFQFNVRFLKTILDELYSCRFGTFLYNCERERAELQVKQNTASLWSFVLDNRMLFINDKYDPNATLDDFTMNAKVHPLFWTDYYCRYSLLQDATDNISVTSSITPNTPLSIAPVLEISQQHSEHSPQTPTNSREPQQQHSQSSPLASPQATPENPTRQRRWTPSTVMPQTYVNTNLLVSELRHHQHHAYQFPNTSTAAAAPLASPTRSSSSAGSDRHIITRV